MAGFVHQDRIEPVVAVGKLQLDHGGAREPVRELGRRLVVDVAARGAHEREGRGDRREVVPRAVVDERGRRALRGGREGLLGEACEVVLPLDAAVRAHVGDRRVAKVVVARGRLVNVVVAS